MQPLPAIDVFAVLYVFFENQLITFTHPPAHPHIVPSGTGIYDKMKIISTNISSLAGREIMKK